MAVCGAAKVRSPCCLSCDGRGRIWSVAFLVDGKHVVSGDKEGKIRRWRVEDGIEVGAPMDAGSCVCNIAVSRDGKWITGGRWQSVQVWNADWVVAADSGDPNREMFIYPESWRCSIGVHRSRPHQHPHPE